MKNDSRLGLWIRRFLLEHLVTERNLSPNTQRSYRDTLRLLLPLLATQSGKRIDALEIEDLSPAAARSFLKDIEENRGCSVITRNQRLSAIHALARFIGERSPEHLPWYGEIRAVPFKRASKTPLTYLEKSEMDALLVAPDRYSKVGQRDRVLLLFLYNSGARASEAAGVKVGDLEGNEHNGVVKLHGKGGKIRLCPLWPRTMAALAPLIANRQPDARVFQNRYSAPLTRFGIHKLVSLTGTGEPSRNEFTERAERKDKEIVAEADGNGRDRSVLTWRGCVLAEAAGQEIGSVAALREEGKMGTRTRRE